MNITFPIRAQYKNIDDWAKALSATLDTMAQQINSANTQLASAPATMIAFAGSVLPDGWLKCDGAEYPINDLPTLAGILGNTFGAAAPGNFKVPDLRDRAAIGASGTHAIGSYIGTALLNLVAANIPSLIVTVTDPEHTHSVTIPNHTHSVTDPQHTHIFTASAHNHTLTDTGHVHGTTESAHNHSLTDPGHHHSINSALSADYTAGASDGLSPIANTTGTSTTGITLAAASTGLTVDSNTTGISLANTTIVGTNAVASTGISINNASLVPTVGTSATGITATTANGTTAVNIQNPAVAINWIIKT